MRFVRAAALVGAFVLISAPAWAQYGYGPPPGYGAPPPGYGPPPGAYQPAPSYEPAPSYGTPPGSYLETCRQISVQGAYLTAVCRNRYGEFQQTQIGVRRCRSFSNLNGRLACGR